MKEGVRTGIARREWQGQSLSLAWHLHGRTQGPAVTLIAGTGRSSAAWSPWLIDALVHAGLRVLVYDHRETGQSSRLHLSRPDLPDLLQSLRSPHALEPTALAYTLDDLTDDLLCVTAAAGVASSVWLGASMGGMLAQLGAARLSAANQVMGLVLLNTSSSTAQAPRPDPQALQAFASVPLDDDPAAAAYYELRLSQVCAGPASGYDHAQARARAEALVASGWHAAGVARHCAAVLTAADRSALLEKVQCPRVVLHGTQNRLVPPGAGRLLADQLGVPLHELNGAGHDLPSAHIAQVVQAVCGLLSGPEGYACSAGHHYHRSALGCAAH